MKPTMLISGALLAGLGAMAVPSTAVAGESCKPTGIGLNAHYVNEVPTIPLEVTCDIGVYFELPQGSIEPGLIDGVTITASTAAARPQQWGIYVAGGTVDVVNSSVTVAEDHPYRFNSVTYVGHFDPAEGRVRGNELSGGHHAAVVIGPGTLVEVSDNSVRGSGPRDTGWPQRGIVVESAGLASVLGNTVRDHWWDADDAVSPGISVTGDHVVVQDNRVEDNDVGMVISGDDNTVYANSVGVTYSTVNIAELYGVVVDGDGNSIDTNTITSETGTGTGLSVGGGDNVVQDNDIHGWWRDVVIRP